MEEENWFEGEPVLRGPAGGMRVWAEVRLDAVVRNLAHIRQLLPPETGIYGVVKAEGYGHGSRQVAAAVQNLDYVKGFAVAAFEEACALRDYGILKPVLVLGYTFPCCYEQMARREIRPAVFRPDSIEALASAASRAGKPIKVHVKVDTGMNRIGIRPDREGLAFMADLAGREGIEIEGIFTHFARADEADKSNAEKQLGTFQEFLHRIERELSLKIPVRHCANSAGALEMDGVGMDAVRAGIAMYGICPSGRREGNGLSLEPALSLYSSIVYVKTVGAGESVSYGGTFTAQRNLRVATVAAGYGDGYPRELSNRGFVLIHGKRAPILGRVCMDQFMVDVTDIPQAAEGDRAVLLGRDGGEQISVEMLAEMSGRFHYEIVCGISGRVPRIHTMDGKIQNRDIWKRE